MPVIWWEGSDQDARALNLALNKIQGSWDEAKLADVLAELAGVESLQEALRGFDTTETALAGFDEREVLAALEAKLGDGPPAEDLTALAGALVSAPARAASAEPGALYELGPNRLLCGDARDLEAVRRLIGVAEPAMLWTDPPYGVNYSAEGSRGAASSGRPGPAAGELVVLDIDACPERRLERARIRRGNGSPPHGIEESGEYLRLVHAFPRVGKLGLRTNLRARLDLPEDAQRRRAPLVVDRGKTH